MTQSDSAEVLRLEAAQVAVRNYFLGWQCRLRQLAVRNDGGRPNAGMRPRLLIEGETLGEAIVLIVPEDAEPEITEFKHMVMRTQDPSARYKSALEKFQAVYYQYPRNFSDRMTALFGADSRIVERLLEAARCNLVFDYYNQRFDIPCEARKLNPQTAAYRATYWHNHLFNPGLPPEPPIIQFIPDWARTQAEPAPP